MTNDAKIIIERICILFKNNFKTRYQISIANDPYDKTYNVFFESQKKYMRAKSTPVHTITTYTLEHLEQVVKELRQKYQFTIVFVGFTGERWPVAQTVIQKKKNLLE